MGLCVNSVIEIIPVELMTMNKLDIAFSILFKKLKISEMISLFLVIILTLHFCILPSVFPLTLKEQAERKREKKRNLFYDEFSKKTPERRDFIKQQQTKEPRLACLLSLIVPGGGHIYLKDDLKGIGFCLLSGAGYATAGYYLYLAYKDDVSSTEKKSKLLIAGLLVLVSITIHIVGIVEAYNDTIELNERRFYFGADNSKSPYIADLIIEQDSASQ